MEEKRKPHITMIWIAIAALSINQVVFAYQNYQEHQNLRELITLHSELHLQCMHEQNQMLENILDALKEEYK